MGYSTQPIKHEPEFCKKMIATANAQYQDVFIEQYLDAKFIYALDILN